MPPVDNNRPLHAFTVDVEDYFQVTAFEQCVSRNNWDGFPCRVEMNTNKILTILAKHQVKATFFILGWIAERYPQLVLEISRAGHEIGSHGYWHRMIYNQTSTEFREDLRQSIAVLEKLLDQPIISYRAPSFSITQKSLWALEILREEGILVDSSVVPIHHDLYGIPNSQSGLHRLETPAGSLWEFPPAVYGFFGNKFTLPVGGGGYFRIYPFRFTRWCFRCLEKRQQALMFYIHPWEVDPDQPRLRASYKSRFRHYSNLHRTLGKLDRLLTTFRFGTIREVLVEHQQKGGFPENADTHSVVEK
jgi:polysaccharide deacetylase family protein (PEP-CTERM system associated)